VLTQPIDEKAKKDLAAKAGGKGPLVSFFCFAMWQGMICANSCSEHRCSGTNPLFRFPDPPSTATLCILRLHHAMRQPCPEQCSCPLILTASRASRSQARNEKLRLAFGFIQDGMLWKARRMGREPGIRDSLVDSLLQSLLVSLDVRQEHERLGKYTPYYQHRVMTIQSTCCRATM